MNKGIKKVIKVGSSYGIIFSAEDMERLGIKVGDEVRVTIEPITKDKPEK